jgi:hypothetical protein
MMVVMRENVKSHHHLVAIDDISSLIKMKLIKYHSIKIFVREKMGYDDFECLVCYQNGRGNHIPDDRESKGWICAQCVGDTSVSRVASVLKYNCDIGTKDCDVCGDISLCHYVTMCNEHKISIKGIKIDDSPFEEYHWDYYEYESELKSYINAKRKQLALKYDDKDVILNLLMSAACKKAYHVLTLDNIYKIVKDTTQ